MTADLHVLQHGERLEQLHELEGAHETAPRSPLRRKAGDVVAIEGDAAFGRRAEARDRVEQRRLAGAVRADDRRNAALLISSDTLSTATSPPKRCVTFSSVQEAHASSFRFPRMDRRESDARPPGA